VRVLSEELMRGKRGTSAAVVVLTWGATAVAQGLPPLPPPPPPPPPPAEAPPPPPSSAPPLVAEPSARPAELGPGAPPPPPPVVRLVYVEPEPPVHAPHFSLWAGGRAGLLAYSGGLYINDQNTGGVETTGNFVRPALGLELDVGARLAKRYIPYLAYELGVTAPGHRFEGVSAQARTEFYGIGFRYLAGDVDSISFASDLSFGIRKFTVSSGGSSWSASGLEIFRLGVGAEVRVNNRFAVSPMVTLSGGSMTDTSGTVSFAPGQGDGQQQPPFRGNGQLPGWAQTSYYAVFIGCGAHVDLLGN
jgi:hypothetical protein